MSGCRIGRVKMRNGAEVLRFPEPVRDDVQRSLSDYASHVLRTFGPNKIQGFIVMAWTGELSLCKVRIEDCSTVGVSVAPHYAQEQTRRALIEQGDY